MPKNNSIASVEQIESQIVLIRGQKVMLSVHLAVLYEVEPRVLIQAVKRNIERFPEDFMFQLSAEEFANLKSQFVISSWGGHGPLPMPSPNRACPCYPVCCVAAEPFKSILYLCAPSSNCARC